MHPAHLNHARRTIRCDQARRTIDDIVASALLLTVRQGVWLRCRADPDAVPHDALAAMQAWLAHDTAPLAEDRRLDPE